MPSLITSGMAPAAAPAKPDFHQVQAWKSERLSTLNHPAMSAVGHPLHKAVVAKFQALNALVADAEAPSAENTVMLMGRKFNVSEFMTETQTEAATDALELQRLQRELLSKPKTDPLYPVLEATVRQMWEKVHPVPGLDGRPVVPTEFTPEQIMQMDAAERQRGEQRRMELRREDITRRYTALGLEGDIPAAIRQIEQTEKQGGGA